ncbi:hypothetical protein PZB74_08660 [Porifericola rhodea]|uniref:hypothetical protein n=1 Tax=Porifericola rhodea TaxID=930972 RepID=UPI002666289F|nr:hypothetical protein [Porifericola rhodea]WKN33404.1 hypothetical protein PZB74_08660 [Porifericola rhodea]
MTRYKKHYWAASHHKKKQTDIYMKKAILLILFCITSLVGVQAQNTFPIITPSQVDLYEYNKYKLMNTTDEVQVKNMSELPNAIFRYEGNTVNATMLNRNLMGEEPFTHEEFTLKLPDMTGMPDTVVMLLGHKNDQGERILSAVLVGNLRNKLAYFIDDNHNFDFTDDGNFLVFQENELFSRVNIATEEKGTFSYILFDLGAHKEYLKGLDIYLIDTKKVREKKIAKYPVPLLSSESRWSMQFAFSTGSGKQYFSYSTPQLKDKQYSATIDAVSRFSASLQYAIRHLNVGFNFAFDANQIGREEQYVLDYSTPDESPKKVTHYNIGNWARSRLMYGVFAEYDIRLIRNSYLSPYFYVFRYHHLTNESFAGYANEISEAFTHNDFFKNKTGHQFGAKIKLPMSEKVLAVFDIGYTENNFGIKEGLIIEDHDPASIKTYYKTFNYGIGCQFLLSNGKSRLSKARPAVGEY